MGLLGQVMARQTPGAVLAPSVATLGGFQGSGLGYNLRRGTPELLAAYSTMPWLRAVAKRIAEATSTVEWEVLVEGPEARGRVNTRALSQKAYGKRRAEIKGLRKAGTLVPVEDHPILRLLERGNELHAGHTVREIAQLSYDLVGEGFWLLDLDGRGFPTNLWPVPPHWVVKTPQPGGEPVYELRAPGAWRRIEVPIDHMVVLRDSDPANPYGRGVGTARSLADELDADEFSAKHIKQWFRNGARPDLLVFGEGLGAKEIEHLEQRWTEKVGGVFKRFRPMFLNRKVEVKELGQNFQEQQIVELRKYERDVVVSVFGIPPEVVSIMQNSNRATSLAADFHMARWVVLPRAEVQRSAYQTQLMPRYNAIRQEQAIVDFVSPVEADAEFVKGVFAAHPYAFNLDETRDLADLPELPDERGKVYPVPFNLVFSREHGDEDGAPGPPAVPEPTPEEPEDEPEDESTGRRARTARAEKITAADVDRILRAIKSGPLEAAIEPVVADVVEAFGESAALAFGSSFDLLDPRVVDFVRHRGAERMVGVADVTKRKVARALRAGIEEGEGINALADRVSGVFRSSRGARSVAIARTETVRSSNFGNLEGMRQAGVEGKQWLSTRDADVRDTHAEMDGQIQSVDDDFVSTSGATGPYPGEFSDPAESVNCRCTTIGAEMKSQRGDPEAEEKLRTQRWKSFERERLPFERAATRALRVAFRVQERAALAALRR